MDNNPRRLKIKHVWFLKAFLVLVELLSLSQFYAACLCKAFMQSEIYKSYAVLDENNCAFPS